jgi:hypothetical protein
MFLMSLLETASTVRRKLFDISPLELPDAVIIRIKDAYALSERSGGSITDRAHTDHDELIRLGRVHTMAEVVLFSSFKFKRDMVIDISARRTGAF